LLAVLPLISGGAMAAVRGGPMARSAGLLLLVRWPVRLTRRGDRVFGCAVASSVDADDRRDVIEHVIG
jgi:hypothetical protein